MRVIVGDECGIIKECIPEIAASHETKDGKAAVAKNVGTKRINAHDSQSRRDSVCGLTWMPSNDGVDDDSFASLTISGTIKIWKRSALKAQNFGCYQELCEIRDIFDLGEEPVNPESKPLGLGVAMLNGRALLCSCNASGKVVFVDPVKLNMLKSFSTLKAATISSGGLYPPLTCMAIYNDNSKSILAIGGRERDVMLFDLESEEQLWKAKNLPPDRQTLLQPLVWPTAIAFLPKKPESIESESKCATLEFTLVVGTAHKEVRVYNVRLSKDEVVPRRPVAVTPKGLLEHRVTSVVPFENNPGMVIIADAAGDVHLLDVQEATIKGRYVGPVGSIRGMAMMPETAKKTQQYVAMVGLDRMLRVYNRNRQMKACLYLQQRLNCCLVGQEAPMFSDDLTAIGMTDIEALDQDDVIRDLDSGGEDVASVSDDGDMPEFGNQSGSEDDDDDDDGADSSGSSPESGDSDEDEEPEPQRPAPVPDKRPPRKRRKGGR